MAKLKLCKDCKYFMSNMNRYATYRDGWCGHSAFQFTKFSRVDGRDHTFNRGGVDVEWARESKRLKIAPRSRE